MITTTGNGRTRRWRVIALAGLLLCWAGPAPAADNPVLLTVGGAVKTPMSLTAEDLAQMPRATAQFERDGETSTYDGVLLYDILVKAGVPFGRDMPGKPMASYILATASDGYQVVFALPEIDPVFAGAKVLVANKKDGGPLLSIQKPLQLIAPQDKLHARSMWSLAKIEVVRLRP